MTVIYIISVEINKRVILGINLAIVHFKDKVVTIDQTVFHFADKTGFQVFAIRSRISAVPGPLFRYIVSRLKCVVNGRTKIANGCQYTFGLFGWAGVAGIDHRHAVRAALFRSQDEIEVKIIIAFIIRWDYLHGI